VIPLISLINSCWDYFRIVWFHRNYILNFVVETIFCIEESRGPYTGLANQ